MKTKVQMNQDEIYEALVANGFNNAEIVTYDNPRKNTFVAIQIHCSETKVFRYKFIVSIEGTTIFCEVGFTEANPYTHTRRCIEYTPINVITGNYEALPKVITKHLSNITKVLAKIHNWS